MALLLAQGLGLIQFFQNRLQGVGLLQLLQRPVERLLQQARAVRRQDRFRVELHPADAIRIVTHRHHHPFKRGVNRQPGRNIAADQ